MFAGVMAGADMIFALKLHTILVVFHLIGLILGFGVAIAVDALMLKRAFFSRINRDLIHTTEFLSQLVTLGLVILWISGIALALDNYHANPKFLTNAKFWAKVCIVIMLTIGAYNIHTNVLPRVRQYEGRSLLDGASAGTCFTWALASAVSIVSWTLPVLLGSARELSYVTPFFTVIFFYVGCIISVFIPIFIFCYLSSKLDEEGKVVIDHSNEADFVRVCLNHLILILQRNFNMHSK
jgi:hypothetical protein